MSMLVATGTAILITISVLGLLVWRDPMRLRVVARGRATEAPGWRPAHRRLLLAAALAPGVLLLILAQLSALIIWCGALLVSGWVLTGIAAPGRR